MYMLHLQQLFFHPLNFYFYFFNLETTSHSKKSKPLCIPNPLKKNRSLRKNHQRKIKPPATGGEESFKLEHGDKMVSGSEEILNAFQTSFPVSGYCMTQWQWSDPNGHSDTHQKSESVYMQQFYQDRRGAFKPLYSDIKICQPHHYSKDKWISQRQYLGWQCIYMNM